MHIRTFKVENVAPNGKVKDGGAVETSSSISKSYNRGCGLERCHCSDGHWISIGNGRDAATSSTSGVVIYFDTEEELNSIMQNPDAISILAGLEISQSAIDVLNDKWDFFLRECAEEDEEEEADEE